MAKRALSDAYGPIGSPPPGNFGPQVKSRKLAPSRGGAVGHLISNDRFPDVPMSTQGVNTAWYSTGEVIPSYDGIPGGQNLLTIGPNGGFSWQRAVPDTEGNYTQPDADVPYNTTARQP